MYIHMHTCVYLFITSIDSISVLTGRSKRIGRPLNRMASLQGSDSLFLYNKFFSRNKKKELEIFSLNIKKVRTIRWTRERRRAAGI